MSVLIQIALKSLLIAGLTLVLLGLMKRRSAAERSWVAHIGLLALVIMAFAPLVLPNWTVEAPALLGQTPVVETTLQTPIISPAPDALKPTKQATSATRSNVNAPPPRSAGEFVSPTAIATAVYALPAVVLLFVTFLALARLIALRARADVLVDGHWLSALARAQRRMGFKHGTALLTSNDLSSPISWGLMRPVILLNSRAVEASAEAEAIIAHELAHVARMDWAKLLLARVATALFWFNPLIWILAREAHQLREEAADDAVLAADVVDTDYAQLLVGVARHECPGLLLGAHGVAPSKSSLARRVARVLDGASVRGPAARPFALGVFAGAVLIAAPLAALTLTPGGPRLAKPEPSTGVGAKVASQRADYFQSSDVPADLPHIIAQGVSTSVATATAAVGQGNDAETQAEAAAERADAEREAALAQAARVREAGLERAAAQRDAALERAADARARAIEQAQDIAERARERAGRYRDDDDAMRALGVTPQYVAAVRSAAPELASVDPHRFVAMKAVGVSPEYIRELSSAGLTHFTLDQIIQARAVGLSGSYTRAAIAAGARPNVADLIELCTVGIRPDQIARARKAGAVTSGQIVGSVFGAPQSNIQIKFDKNWPFEGTRRKPSAPPRTGLPAASPPDWKTSSG